MGAIADWPSLNGRETNQEPPVVGFFFIPVAVVVFVVAVVVVVVVVVGRPSAFRRVRRCVRASVPPPALIG